MPIDKQMRAEFAAKGAFEPGPCTPRSWRWSPCASGGWNKQTQEPLRAR